MIKPEKSSFRRSKDGSHCKLRTDSIYDWRKIGEQVTHQQWLRVCALDLSASITSEHSKGASLWQSPHDARLWTVDNGKRADRPRSVRDVGHSVPDVRQKLHLSSCSDS